MPQRAVAPLCQLTQTNDKEKLKNSFMASRARGAAHILLGFGFRSVCRHTRAYRRGTFIALSKSRQLAWTRTGYAMKTASAWRRLAGCNSSPNAHALVQSASEKEWMPTETARGRKQLPAHGQTSFTSQQTFAGWFCYKIWKFNRLLRHGLGGCVALRCYFWRAPHEPAPTDFAASFFLLFFS